VISFVTVDLYLQRIDVEYNEVNKQATGTTHKYGTFSRIQHRKDLTVFVNTVITYSQITTYKD